MLISGKASRAGLPCHILSRILAGDDYARGRQPFCCAHLDRRSGGVYQCVFCTCAGDRQPAGRVVDRTRTLVKDLHGAEIDPATRTLWVSHLDRLEKRGALLVRAMSFFYSAIGCFAAASVVSILGASVVSSNYKWPFEAIVVISFVLGTIGFVGLAVGCSLLVNETRLALRSIYEEAQLARSWFK